jgi:hypothetical protein
MKRIFVFLLSFSFSTNLLNAQGKEGNVWILGYPSTPGFPISYIGGTKISFENGGIDTSKFVTPRSMFSSSSIADDSGNLLFYSNGCDIINQNHEIMANGENINGVGVLYDLYCTGELFAYGELQDMLILPIPKNEDLYKVIHIRYPVPGQAISQIRQSTVDMSLNGSLGAVVDKNVLLFDGGPTNGYLTAIRHGNGVDWWISLPEWHTKRKFVFLLDSLWLHGPDIQNEAGILIGSGGKGQSAFSPDGTKYAEICFSQGQVMDFNRCTGKFSNPVVINYDSSGANQWAGVAFSPNNRFMYVARFDSLYQFDMSSVDFNSTRQTVAKFDGIFDSTGLRGPGFYTLLNGPDDKIYINSPSSTKALHVIHHPNEPGIASGFQKWGLELPTLHYGQLPNLPNFRLGAVNPPCTVSTDDVQADAIILFPNPVEDYIVVSNQKSDLAGTLTFQLYDALGRLLLDETFDDLPHRIELAGLPKAEYFYRVFSDGGKRLSSGVLVKITTK